MVNISSSSRAFLKPLNQLTNLPISLHHYKSSSFVKAKATMVKPFSCELKNHASGQPTVANQDKKLSCCQTELTKQENPNVELSNSAETRLYSINPLPLLFLAALPGGIFCILAQLHCLFLYFFIHAWHLFMFHQSIQVVAYVVTVILWIIASNLLLRGSKYVLDCSIIYTFMLNTWSWDDFIGSEI